MPGYRRSSAASFRDGCLLRSTFTVVDALTGATIDGTLIDFSDLTGLIVYKIFDLATDYAEADLQQVRIVQDGTDALLLHNELPAPDADHHHQLATASSRPPRLTTRSFYDGPYLDIPTDGTTLTPSATSGSITFTASAITSINDGDGFLSTDVGRMFRVFSEPAAWAVRDGLRDRQCRSRKPTSTGRRSQASTGKQPSTDAGIYWVIDTTAAAWTWGTIASITSTSPFVGTLHAAVTYPDNTAGGNLLYANRSRMAARGL
jgi:hypothetical protein